MPVLRRSHKLDQTTTFATVTTSLAGKAGASSGAAKAARLAARAATTTGSDNSKPASSSTKKSKTEAETSTSASHKALDHVATTSSASATTASSTATATATSSASAVPSNYKLPRAFDSTLGTNFTSTACPSFFATFLADPDFIACAPFSLLLATSSAFFKAQQSPDVLLPYVMDATCAANQTSCSAVMDSYALQIKGAGTCGPDLTKRNPLVVQALSGFQNYDMMYQAGCLQNNQTGQYCFAQAAAASTASELYFWYLPEGTGLPSGTQTSCDSCTQDLMDIYATYATNSSLLISGTYGTARTLAVTDCGPTFAQYVAQASSATRTALAAPAVQLSLVLAAIGWWAVV